MVFGFGLSLTAINTLSAVQRAINILKSAGPGAWYDPSDLATMFQDSAGTTPVTAVEQPVGRILDKSGGGNHAIQPTATSRPTLSSRYNLLTKTEQFDDVYWAKGSATVTANATTAPDGTTTADSLIEAAATASPYIGRTAAGLPVTSDTFFFSLYVKANGRNQVCLSFYGGATNKYITAVYDLSTGTVSKTQAGSSGTITSTSITASGSGWYRIVMSGNTAAPAQMQAYAYLTSSTTPTIDAYGTPTAYAGDGTSGIYIWGASLVPASDASLPYQRVNTATDYDYDFSKFPAYLKFDGVDDSMYSAASIDFTSTDKMTVFAGVHKVGITSGAVLETSATSDTNNGSFSYFTGAWSDARDYFSTRGTVLSYPSLSVTPPVTYVIAAASNISGDLITVRSNSVQVVNSSADLGTGNFGNYPLYIGRRNNASLPFNGRLYQLALKGKSMTAAEITTVESFINSKTKAYDPTLQALLTEAGNELATESDLYIEME